MKGSISIMLCFGRRAQPAVRLVSFAMFFLAGCSSRVADPDFTLPAPSNLQIVASGSESVTLGWFDNSEDESDFIIWQSLYQKRGYQEVAQIDCDMTAATITGLADTLEYYFRVSAFNESGGSRQSNIAHRSIRRFTVGDPLTDYRGMDQDYSDFHLYDYRGKVLFIYFAELEEG